jgi:putative phosphoesterase
MKLGIIADTHNNIENTRRALEVFREQGVERIFHCGDISTPAVIELFAGWDATFVFGNIDHHHADLMTAVRRVSGLGRVGYHYTGEVDGIRIAVCHGDEAEQFDDFVRSGLYRYVFHGHTHRRRDEIIGTTRVINPGAVGGQQRESRSVCVVDLETGEAQFIEIEDWTEE